MDVLAPVLRHPNEPQKVELVSVGDPRTGEVLVRMVAAGVCHSCLSVEKGAYPDVPLPMILGDEGAGVVEAVGPGCDSLRPGDHVILSWAPVCGRCHSCAAGLPALCSNTSPFQMRDGTTRFESGGTPIQHFGPSTYSSYVVVDATAAVKIRADMPLDKAALIGCAVTTGVGAVLNTAQVRPGQSAVVFGCGGIGLNAIQGAALAGAQPVIAVDLAEHKLEAAKTLGADVQINAQQTDPIGEVLAHSAGGVDCAVVAVGSTAVMEQALAVLRPRGVCVLVGAPRPGDLVRVDPGLLTSGERRIVGSKYGSSNPHQAFPELVELYLAGKLRLDELIGHRYRLDQINEASAALDEGRDLRGLIVFD
ncbi:Zn-dependent alcohol dehydrogenase [Amycolatopsis sp. NPDC006131]|uniref:Zn-dependent alcohol dehydrogenase n=1 Tax=Amycolatopsis sp. NPDC006131 TaxID=3156731 RepID=UPI0033A22E75